MLAGRHPLSIFKTSAFRLTALAFFSLALTTGVPRIAFASALACHSIFEGEVETRSQLIDLMTRLPENATIPAAVFQKSTTNEIASAIIDRVRAQELLNPDIINSDTSAPVDLKNDTDLVMFFWTTDSASIQAKGFLNQHQTGKASGMFNPILRRAAEDSIVGLHLGEGDLPAKVRPKSAFINVRAPVDLGEKKRTCIAPEFYGKNPDVENRAKRSGYGNVAAVFKPEVKKRSLWIVDDSYWLAGSKLQGDLARLKIRGTFDRSTISKVDSGIRSYFEANIYGDLGVGDVDYFLVFDEALAPDLVRFGRPIYLAAPEILYRRVIFSKKMLLYSGEN